jgi:hypothetical protein
MRKLKHAGRIVIWIIIGLVAVAFLLKKFSNYRDKNVWIVLICIGYWQ